MNSAYSPTDQLEAVGKAQGGLMPRTNAWYRRRDEAGELANAEVDVERQLAGHNAHEIDERRGDGRPAGTRRGETLKIVRLLNGFRTEHEGTLRGTLDDECSGTKGGVGVIGGIAGNAQDLSVGPLVATAEDDRQSLDLSDGLRGHQVEIGVVRGLPGQGASRNGGSGDTFIFEARRKTRGDCGNPFRMSRIFRDDIDLAMESIVAPLKQPNSVILKSPTVKES